MSLVNIQPKYYYLKYNYDFKKWRVVCLLLLQVNGGKIRPSKKMQKELDDFKGKHAGEMILYVVIEDEIKAIMSLSGECAIHIICTHNMHYF
jgi:hypothetical protein